MTTTLNESVPTDTPSARTRKRGTKVRRQRVRAAWTYLAPMTTMPFEGKPFTTASSSSSTALNWCHEAHSLAMALLNSSRCSDEGC